MKRIAIILILTAFIGGALTVGVSAFKHCSEADEVARIQNDFVSQVWPAPDSEIPIKCYLTSSHPVFLTGEGVGVTLVSGRIDHNWHTPPAQSIEERASIRIDETELQEEASVVYALGLSFCDEENNCQDTGRPAGIFLRWKPFLFFGEHEALVQVVNDMGEILEYSWRFKITW